MNRKFKVGDRVRHAHTTNGKVAIVTKVGTAFRASDGRIRYDGVSLDFMTRSPKNLTRARYINAIYAPENLRHDYDGATPAAWSDCVWKPRELIA